MNKNERGFVALMSVIIISATLLVVIITGSLTSFFSRFNTLDSELKERSNAAADSCVDSALLQLAQNPAYTGSVLSLNSIDTCRIGKIIAGANTYQFEVQATSSDTAVTNLQVVANSNDLSVISWQEIPKY